MKLVAGDGAARGQPWRQAVIIIASCAILIRLCVGLHSYSGMNTPPTFGDYEAQRHWMEVTTNLPADEWYRNTPRNNLSHWGLDYPPLSGYQSWLCGKFVEYFDPPAVALQSSRGYESPYSKLLLRQTVILSDILCYLPAAVACALAFYSHPRQQLVALVATLLNPELIIIDHGHFQYNCISLGFAMGSFAAVARGKYLIGAALFSASLNHKQMSLYFAPAIFAHLLGRCLRRPSFSGKVVLFLSLGIAVGLSFAAAWAPFLSSQDAVLTMLRRIFPTQRGLFEDYVANFWCVSSLIVKWKRLLALSQLLKICTGATLLAFIPSMLMEATRPSQNTFLLCLANTAMSFFMLSFQVHEKSILLPLLPVTMMMAGHQGVGPSMINASMLSMYPLLKKDGLSEAYWALLLMHLGVSLLLWESPPKRPANNSNIIEKVVSAFCCQHPAVSLAGVGAVHLATSVIELPPKYPFLADAIMVSWAFLYFASMFVYTYMAQYRAWKTSADSK